MKLIKFWPFPILRNYEESRAVTELFLRFSASKSLRTVKVSGHQIHLSCELGEVRFWSENQYYAWANEGAYTSQNGECFSWIGKMPSRYAVRALRQALAKEVSRMLDRAAA